ncbi:amylo-alpha-1,6-glucosidase [Sulfobacillus harzensis]|uniref:Glycogen debranching protein n=1 Tax=Sulfobacillus harzensis TaxID=2729629 RepID=A0A7Y0Q4L2_9FIRM|nr:amylo-alpha-1,6-glucosidase [Sulfobacillus harzensis]NMP24136.1 hypothetical protein [Sulfobacillus harzensis]
MKNLSEWLLTNGTGSYAMGSIDRRPHRRYHSLYTQALHPPRDRRVILTAVAVDLKVGQQWMPLWSAHWGSGATGPGPQGLTTFRLEHGIPHYRWDVGAASLTESIWLAPGFEGVVLRYDWQSPMSATLRLVPLLAGRNHHQLGARTPSHVETTSETILVGWNDDVWTIRSQGGVLDPRPDWYHHIWYPEEAWRGYAAHEDLWTPGSFEIPLPAGSAHRHLMLCRPAASSPPERIVDSERQRRAQLSPEARLAEMFVADLAHGSSAVIAGFPWFTDWSRDTFIALPGLSQALPQKDLPNRILTRYFEMPNVPNRWPEGGEGAPGHSADAGLWFVNAATSMAMTGKLQDRRGCLQAVDAVLTDYVLNRIPGVHVDDNGLLDASMPDTALTWMDAALDGKAVTPRPGKAVEIQALWYNALRLRDVLAESLGQGSIYSRLSESIYRSFNHLFPRPNGGLRDTLGTDDQGAERPNQLYAVGLPHPVAHPRYWETTLEATLTHLWRPFGLLSLGPDDRHFRARYGPGLVNRDLSYHQGMAWPYLLGIFFDALERTAWRRHHDHLLSQVQYWLFCHQRQAGLDGVSEILEPNRGIPQGAPFQAWSAAELIRLLGPHWPQSS